MVIVKVAHDAGGEDPWAESRTRAVIMPFPQRQIYYRVLDQYKYRRSIDHQGAREKFAWKSCEPKPLTHKPATSAQNRNASLNTFGNYAPRHIID